MDSYLNTDPFTTMLFLEVHGSKVVLLQAYFESYEGIGIVRTIDIKKSLVCIITTPNMLDNCLQVLDSIKDDVSWRIINPPKNIDENFYLGFGKHSQGEKVI